MIRALVAVALMALPPVATNAPATLPTRAVAVRGVQGATLTATWYGAALHGRLTAWHLHGRPGTRFDRHALTCAHRTLPFGSRLRVTRGTRAVTVTVTDRGPEAWTGSDLDLSEAAAVALGMRDIGRASVNVGVLQ